MTRTTTQLFTAAVAGAAALATFSLYTFPAAAYESHYGGGEGDRTTIRTSSEAEVMNQVVVTANTGDNNTNGGSGGYGGDGGDATRGDAGRGGVGGRGGDGGTITTGDATAIGTVSNDINSTTVTVDPCGCEDDQIMDRFFFFDFGDDGRTSLRINTENSAGIMNDLTVAANTGRNEAVGGSGGYGGDGGDAEEHHTRSWTQWFNWWNQGGTGGDSGAGGGGAAGGTIRTGAALADGLVTNVVNRTVVRSAAEAE